MGQYHKTVNLDKKQWIDPHQLGDGLKLLEQVGWSPGGVNDALHLLLACSSGRGGGDFQSDSPLIGSWAGDRIAVIGDYAKPDDIPGMDISKVYSMCGRQSNLTAEELEAGFYTDITPQLIPIMEQEYECVYAGDGWCDRIHFSDIEGFAGSHGRGGRTIEFHKSPNSKEMVSVPASTLRDILKAFVEKHGTHSDAKMTPKSLGLLDL